LAELAGHFNALSTTFQQRLKADIEESHDRFRTVLSV
jgi:hypothetical protein